MTKENINKVLAIFLDGQPISTPVIRDEITSGDAVISGGFKIPEAKELARNLNYGALPVPIKLISQTTIGATLGNESIIKRAQDKSLIEIMIHDLRKWGLDDRHTVDDRPYCGGPGMIMRVDVVDSALKELKTKKFIPDIIISSNQKRALDTASIIKKEIDKNILIKIDKLIAERKAGIAEGKKEEEIDWSSYEKKPLRAKISVRL